MCEKGPIERRGYEGDLEGVRRGCEVGSEGGCEEGCERGLLSPNLLRKNLVEFSHPNKLLRSLPPSRFLGMRKALFVEIL